MSLLILVGTTVLIAVLVQRMSSVSGGIASSAVAGALADEPAGTRIAGTSMAPDRLAIQLQGGGPDRVVMLDLKTGRVLARVALAQ